MTIRDRLILEALQEILSLQMKIFQKVHWNDFVSGEMDGSILDNARRIYVEILNEIKE